MDNFERNRFFKMNDDYDKKLTIRRRKLFMKEKILERKQDNTEEYHEREIEREMMKFYEEDGETEHVKEINEGEYVRKYKRSLQENCIKKTDGEVVEIRHEYYHERIEIEFTREEMKRLLQQQLIKEGKHVNVYHEETDWNVLIIDDKGRFLRMKQIQKKTMQGNRWMSALREMAQEEKITLKNFYKLDYCFEIQ